MTGNIGWNDHFRWKKQEGDLSDSVEWKEVFSFGGGGGGKCRLGGVSDIKEEHNVQNERNDCSMKVEYSVKDRKGLYVDKYRWPVCYTK